MNKKTVISIFFLLLFSCTLNAQERDNYKAKVESERLMSLYHKLEGTYQVQVIDSREKVAFPLTILDSVVNTRDLNQTKYIWLKSNVRLMILPYNTINKKGFTPLSQTAYYSSKNLPENQ